MLLNYVHRKVQTAHAVACHRLLGAPDSSKWLFLSQKLDGTKWQWPSPKWFDVLDLKANNLVTS